MKKINFILIIALGFGLMISCGGSESTNDVENVDNAPLDTTSFLADLKLLEDRINKSEGIPSDRDLKSAITNFQDYAVVFPTDKKSPDYLLKASDFAHIMRQYQKSVIILENIIATYPDYEKMESVKYNRASHLDFELRDTTKAKIAYQEFMDTYPNSPLVNDCKSRIKNIRYSIEELTEKFIKDLESGENQSDVAQ